MEAIEIQRRALIHLLGAKRVRREGSRVKRHAGVHAPEIA